MAPGVIASIDGDCPGERLLVSSVSDADGAQVELCRQSWSDSVGWYTQGRIRVSGAEIGQLRALLGCAVCPAKPVRRSAAEAEDAEPRIVKFPTRVSA